ncbi:MAG: hypothetical protein P1P82_07680 [Bacteroidales bacterium]|nr:hypothetical protein [Bacteroidales bacterium]MDT8430408.1 hypothetical protein [Bacteroidales bacterium]
METDLLDYTRAFFPTALFDTAWIDGRYVFGKKGDTYCAMIASDTLTFRDEAKDDIILHGKQSFWITEAGSATEDGDFGTFTRRILENPVTFNRKKRDLTYISRGKTYKLTFGKDFSLDGDVVNTQYPRYDAPYAKAEKKDPTLTFEHNGESLFLDFENLVRKY